MDVKSRNHHCHEPLGLSPRFIKLMRLSARVFGEGWLRTKPDKCEEKPTYQGAVTKQVESDQARVLLETQSPVPIEDKPLVVNHH